MELEKYTFAVPRLDLGDDHYSGLESFDGIKNFLNKILLTVDNIKNNLHVFNTLYRGKNINELKDLKDIKNEVDSVIKTQEFYLIENTEVAGISGLKSLSIAGDKLPELVKYVNNNTLKYLEEAIKVLDKFIVNEDFRKSFINNNNVDFKAWRKGINIEDTLNSFIDLNTITDKVKVKDVIPNLISLKNTRENLIKAAEATDIYQLHLIEKAIDSIVAKVKIIEKNIDIVESNKVSIGIVADILSDLGNLVRYHSLTYYVTSEVSKVLINIVKTLNKK